MADIQIPTALLKRLWLAIPEDRAQRPVAMATQSRTEFEVLLRAAGYDPATCELCRASLATVEKVHDWSYVEIVDLAPPP